MRIIGGRLKGRKVILPKRFSSRPTTDFAREALFNFLENQYDFSDAQFCDLFGGSGAISFEFISRGGLNAVCLELDTYNFKNIHENVKLLGVEAQMDVLRQDAFKWVKRSESTFKIIFADPPFTRTEKYDQLVSSIFAGPILESGGMLILEHPEKWDANPEGIPFEKRTFGNQAFCIFTKP